MENSLDNTENPQHDAKLPVVGSAFSDKQKASLLYTVRQIIDYTKRMILTEKELSDEEIIKMIEEDFFNE